MKSFTLEAIKSIKNSGTVASSSKYLVNQFLEGVDFKKPITIVEFGTGDGCITEEILFRMNKDSKLIAFEINDAFYDFCKAKFAKYPNFELRKDSALDLDKVLAQNNLNQVDYILSSLPLSIMDDELVDGIMDKVKNHLKPNGSFVQYMYTLGKYRYFKGIFSNIKLNFTLRNIPPAIVYTCIK